MELLTTFIDIILHLDRHLIWLVQNYGTWVYLILFLIIFCETGLVVMPFLPGDSLLFVAGAIAATGAMDVQLLAMLLMLAAVCGDNTNYWIGRYFGPRMFTRTDSPLLNRAHLEKTNQFYARHGGKTIIFARFLPIIRTFAPFVAGIGRMVYPYFLAYSAFGSIFWISFFVFGGFFFGNVPVVKNNLTYFIFGIIIISVLPGIIQFIRNWLGNRAASQAPIKGP
ncbi:DedA family protein [Nitrosovibrio sp. Nv4]|uniref:DedA family protein n=1 Tax=Nitrosovibrio sp. Nv4 TaxID=1945880 RepID=UPI000BDD1C75|nr:DedA family protein [Nitrosovibrio sp. Nv4]SOD39874.1 membrane-associated protein [Nitrosovibrio sp. Nv4]